MAADLSRSAKLAIDRAEEYYLHMFDKFKGAVSGLVQQQKLNALSRENLDTYRDTVVRLYSDLVPDSRKAASLQGQQRAFSLSPTDVSRRRSRPLPRTCCGTPS
jgi:hypothetical protein